MKWWMSKWDKNQKSSTCTFLTKSGITIKLCILDYFILNKLSQLILLIFCPSIALAKYDTLLAYVFWIFLLLITFFSFLSVPPLLLYNANGYIIILLEFNVVLCYMAELSVLKR